MTITEAGTAESSRPDTAAEDPAVELTVHWDGALRAQVQRGQTTVFACTVTRRPTPAWFITECIPQRRAPDTAAMLLAVCDRLAAEDSAIATIVIHPEFLDDDLQAAGVGLLHRIVPMWLPLQDDLLAMHGRPLPLGYDVEPLEPSAPDASTAPTAPTTPTALAALAATAADRDGDQRVWQEVLAGDFGPLIEGACLQLVEDTELRGAIAITEYQGTPLIAHMVVSAGERGTGLGRALLVAALQGLSAAGYVDCRLNVVEDNWVARRLYRSVGFLQRGPVLRVGYLGPRQASNSAGRQ